MNERLQQLRKRFSQTMEYLRLQRNLMSEIGVASQQSYLESPDVPEHAECTRAAAEAAAAIDRLRSAMVRAMDRVEMCVEADGDAAG